LYLSCDIAAELDNVKSEASKLSKKVTKTSLGTKRAKRLLTASILRTNEDAISLRPSKSRSRSPSSTSSKTGFASPTSFKTVGIALGDSGGVIIKQEGVADTPLSPKATTKSAGESSVPPTPDKGIGGMSPSLFPLTPDKGGKSREIIGVGDYFLVKKNTFVIASPKPHLVLGKILAYNCNGEMGELVFYTQVGKNDIAEAFEKHFRCH
jgi:hypothetical protein